MQVVAAFDNWQAAVSTYRRNIGLHVQILDLADVERVIDKISHVDADLIVGGPPCQDFSTAGKRVEGKQANLTVTFSSVVASRRPRFYLMENVPQVQNSKSYQIMKETLQDAGYEIVDCVLDAAHCGVPQRRRRFFSFGWRDGRTRTGQKFLTSLNDRMTANALTVKEYLQEEIAVEYYYRHPRNYSRRSVFSVYEPSPTVRGVNRPVPPNYRGNHLDRVPPASVRPLTSQERGRIQTFPKEWIWDQRDRNAELELQIGNAVPVNLATFVGEGVRDAIN